MPALPLHEAGKYVAAAYIVFFTLVLIYVAIMAIRLSRLERDLSELLPLAEAAVARDSDSSPAAAADPAEPHALSTSGAHPRTAGASE
jgi:hypothetical protein